MSYYDDFTPDHYRPSSPDPPPARPGLPRLLGAVLLGLLAVLHACS
ncbi:hypothetical protein [Hymenobacter baengnokdamensis]|nr:hypothetical protein [Hymenobacter baengnokdamensis]